VEPHTMQTARYAAMTEERKVCHSFRRLGFSDGTIYLLTYGLCRFEGKGLKLSCLESGLMCHG